MPILSSRGATPSESQRIKRLFDKGVLVRLCPGIYSDEIDKDPNVIIKSNLWSILGKMFHGCVISNRTAFELSPSVDNEIFLTHAGKSRLVKIGNITIKLQRGYPPVDGFDNPFPGGCFLASPERALLENLSPAKSNKNKNISYLEDSITMDLKRYGESYIQKLRSRLKTMSEILNMPSEYSKVCSIIGSIMSTSKDHTLSGLSANSYASGCPFDESRILLFNELIRAINKTDIQCIKSSEENNIPDSTLPFFESYFSNYIEGTTMSINEAVNIVSIPGYTTNKPSDSHDIRELFKLLSVNIKTPLNIIKRLKSDHFDMSVGHQDILPGVFKSTVNRAGMSEFVHPEYVTGTLKEGFNMMKRVESSFGKAIFAQFVISETHPFNDGNGRISRLIMNSYMDEDGLCRIIIPTVFREDYIVALKTLSSKSNPIPFIHMMEKAHRFTASIDFSDLDIAIDQLSNANAFSDDPDDVLLYHIDNISYDTDISI